LLSPGLIDITKPDSVKHCWPLPQTVIRFAGTCEQLVELSGQQKEPNVVLVVDASVPASGIVCAKITVEVSGEFKSAIPESATGVDASGKTAPASGVGSTVPASGSAGGSALGAKATDTPASSRLTVTTTVTTTTVGSPPSVDSDIAVCVAVDVATDVFATNAEVAVDVFVPVSVPVLDPVESTWTIAEEVDPESLGLLGSLGSLAEPGKSVQEEDAIIIDNSVAEY
jgi:hypothetical protein